MAAVASLAQLIGAILVVVAVGVLVSPWAALGLTGALIFVGGVGLEAIAGRGR